MSNYSEDPVCNLGVPIDTAAFCASVLITPIPEDLPLRLTMGGTTYNGFLKTDMPMRINRVGRLITDLWKRINFINASFSTVLSHTFKYPRALVQEDEPIGKTVSGSAFGFIRLMLIEIDQKINNLVLDLEEIRPVASIPEHWQIRPESNRPMAVFLFGEWEEGSEMIDSPKWQICVPHAVLESITGFDNTFGYMKGSYQYLYTLNDNSKIIFYGDEPTEMDGVLERWKDIIDPAFLGGAFLKPGPIKGLPFSIRRLRLVRIDWYAAGILKSTPTNYIKFPRRPAELPPLQP